jgi:multisubunit Na+/H+ antiporter MnhB subunit
MFKDINLNYKSSDVFESNNALYITACLIPVVLLLGILAWVVVAYSPVEGLKDEIARNIELSGVQNPVTAVLLNFRAYDTLLELAVLLIASLTVCQFSTASPFFSKLIPTEKNDIVLDGLQQVLAPLIVLVSGYLLWTGANNPGGAFQAASLLAGAGVLLLQVGHYQLNFNALVARVLVVFGLLVFLIAAATPVFFGYTLLTIQPEMAGVIILIIESAATLSISVILLSLYYGLDNNYGLDNSILLGARSK